MKRITYRIQFYPLNIVLIGLIFRNLQYQNEEKYDYYNIWRNFAYFDIKCHCSNKILG